MSRIKAVSSFLPEAALILISFFSSTPLFWGVFRGEDEAMQWRTSKILVDGLFSNNLQEFLKAIWSLSTENHPPARYLMSAIGVSIFPTYELGVRFISILLGAALSVLVYRVCRSRLSGAVAQPFLVSSFIAFSGIFSYTSMGFLGNALAIGIVIVTNSLAVSGIPSLGKPAGRRRYLLLQIVCLVMFLINTSFVLTWLMLLLMVLIQNRFRLLIFIRASGLTLLCIPLYYLYIFGFVYLVNLVVFNSAEPNGQLFQYLYRSGSLGLSLSSLYSNFGSLSYYYSPYIGQIVAISGLLVMAFREQKAFIWISPYLFLWSFVASGITDYYFLIVTPALVISLGCFVDWRSTKYQKLFGAFAALAISLNLVTNIQLLIRPVTLPLLETDLPAFIGSNRPSRQHNIVYDYRGLLDDMSKELKASDRCFSLIDGSVGLFYSLNSVQSSPLVEKCFSSARLEDSNVLIVTRLELSKMTNIDSYKILAERDGLFALRLI